MPDINSQASQAVKEIFNDPKLKRQIEYEINRQMRTTLVKDGRITNVRIEPTEINMDVETASKF